MNTGITPGASRRHEGIVRGISVIIATYNRAALLDETLAAIADGRDPGVPVAVIVADNGSTDQTRAVFDRHAAARPGFEWLHLREPRPGKSYAVNTAIAHSHGDYLAFTDDDVRPERDWLAALTDAFLRSDADFVVGRILAIWESPAPEWLTPPLYGVLGVPDNGRAACEVRLGVNEHIMPIGTNMAVRRSVVEQIGGLRLDLGKLRGTLRTGEDHDFYLRLLHAGCRGVYAPGARVHHLVPVSRLSRPYFRRWYHQNGRNVATLESGYPARTPMLFGLPRYKWRQAATDAVGLLRATLAADGPKRFRHALALLWFAGYLRERWFGPRVASAAVGAKPAVVHDQGTADARVRA